MIWLTNCLVVFFCVIESIWAYQIPTPVVLTSRKGFQVYIQHEYGITHVRVEAKRFSVTAVGSPDSWSGNCSLTHDRKHWIYQNDYGLFQTGDTLLYKIYVIKTGAVYDKAGFVCIDCGDNYTSTYMIPNPSIEVYRKGFEVFVPHVDGITFVGVETKRNAEITTGRAGTWSGFSLLPLYGKNWIYTNPDAELRLGDTLHYKISVTKDGQFYTKKGSTHIVKHNDNDSTPYVIPEPRIEVYRKGFEISIQHEDGITHVGIEADRNSMIIPYMGGTWSGFSSLAYENTHWVYKNCDAKFKKGDILYYAIYVTKDQMIYTKFNGTYSVKNYDISIYNTKINTCCLT